MNDNDMFSKLSQLLENPQSADVIKQIASSFSAPSSSNSEAESVPAMGYSHPSEEHHRSQQDMPLDFDRIRNVMSAVNHNDKNISLLHAIEPYLSQSRAGKVESAIRAIQIIRMISYLK